MSSKEGKGDILDHPVEEASSQALFGHSPVMHAAGGILGLVLGMLVETLLFIIRASSQDRKTTFTASKLKKNQ
nr:uncharacterized protein [Tanacetum cinerariifolium]